MVHHNHKYKHSCPSTTLTCSLLIYRVFEKNVSKMIAALLQKDLYLNINNLSTAGGRNVVAFLLCNLYLKQELKRKPSCLYAGLVVLNSRYPCTVMSCSNHRKQNFIHSIKGVERKINGYMWTGGKMMDGETKYHKKKQHSIWYITGSRRICPHNRLRGWKGKVDEPYQK